MAGRAFAELQGFFASRRQLQTALAWTPPTVRQWLTGDVPARPRAQSVRDVVNLLEVCRAASRWVSDSHRVGEWAVTPQPALKQVPPAVMVQRLGSEAVATLVENMAAIAPRERVASEQPDLSIETLRATLRSLGAPTIKPVEPVDDVDISDFDD